MRYEILQQHVKGQKIMEQHLTGLRDNSYLVGIQYPTKSSFYQDISDKDWREFTANRSLLEIKQTKMVSEMNRDIS